MKSTHRPRGLLIAGNWKMNQSIHETEIFFSDLQKNANLIFGDQDFLLLKDHLIQVCIFPSFTHLVVARRDDLCFPISLGAQNAHWEDQGAFTGEISGPMLKDMGVEWVLIGHSERRQFFGETDLTVQKKTKSLLKQGFHVIFCIGETREEYESGRTLEVLNQQINEGIPDLLVDSTRPGDPHFIIAYEPVWAIGTGLSASAAKAEEVHQKIRSLLSKKIGPEFAHQTPILYGGSVTPHNIASLLEGPNIDGVLVGGASLKSESFLSLIQAGLNSQK